MSIGDKTFWGCSSLAAITIPDGVTRIGHHAFMGCSSLTAITIPDTLTTIGDFAFCICSSLEAITIPEGVTTISRSAFDECSSLTAITIPDSVTTLSYRAFSLCSSLTRFSLSPAVFIDEDCFLNCTALIAAAADQNMSTVSDLLHSRWHRIRERAAVLSCLKTPWNDLENQPGSDNDGVEVVTLQGAAAFKKLPKVMWRVILEFL
ncbi:hypothetical protein TrCOL_g12837 [Triparma columacea]|uniref:Uncharacterized protein n=1 Tax=Triparma columacea TaxID=722753 RepID=A0A9W7GR29_9STRA|nr:hypothetical protein TrCOL_g12837 [Triparma columacea]